MAKKKFWETVERAWAFGSNIGQLGVQDIASATFSLLLESWRPALLRQVGMELDKRGVLAHRQGWSDLLAETGRDDVE